MSMSPSKFRWAVFSDDCLVGAHVLEKDARKHAADVGGDVQLIKFAPATADEIEELRSIERMVEASFPNES